MLHADNALFYEIIRTAHCPDPRCAARFRPFAPATERVRPAVITTMRTTDAVSACCPDKAAEPERCC